MFLAMEYFMPKQQPAGNPQTVEKENTEEGAIVEEEEDIAENTDSPESVPSDPSSGDTVKSAAATPVTAHPAAFVTLGSADPKSPYQMLVTISGRGASVARIEMNNPAYRDVQDPSGWMGQIVVDLDQIDTTQKGCPVQTVGAGTPAEKAGLLPGDTILRFDNSPIDSFGDLREVLRNSRPRSAHKLTVLRNGRERTLDIVLAQPPLNIVRPELPLHTYADYADMPGLHGYTREYCSPLSFLMTINQLDAYKLAWPEHILKRPASSGESTRYDKTIDRELKDVHLRSVHWELVSASQEKAVYKHTVPRGNLEVRKTYRLKPLSEEEKKSGTPSYALSLQVEVKNLDTREHTVAYQLDGPNGLPTEGAWYASGRKTGPGWSAYGIRDLVVRFHNQASDVKRCYEIGMDKGPAPEQWQKTSLDYLGVDTQYFQCTMIPQKEKPDDVWHSFIVPMRVGDYEKNWGNTTNVSFRMVSQPQKLAPNESLRHTYQIFAGPKKPEVLERYGLRDTLYYGWFAWFVKPMLSLLHFFHAFTFNYALAVIMLTVVVRLCLYRFSRKQVLNTMKMQALKPEIDAISAKYKDNMEARMKATQELYRKHKFNPASGCLTVFIQLPILVALYKALSVDVELYGAPFLTEGVRWCSDLAAPDKLVNWSGLWNSIGWPNFNNGYGMFSLGPYLNVLPLITVILFLIQQKVMMPPPTSDQEKSMRTTMQFMMFFMAFMFYKVPSGLCIYFIASTLFGLAEKQFMPKAIHLTPAEENEISAKPLQKKQSQKPKKEPAGFMKKVYDLLEEAKHKPGDSQKPGKRRKP
ncbi:MAG: YidC/Oxa1 family insertase periplasmic-domain containing protein [Planctomycetaceae bacterium]|nr:YidC/Oxa1 family insertase periplasmic-domain containing protein [Planctomycetaceae bacterium]